MNKTHLLLILTVLGGFGGCGSGDGDEISGRKTTPELRVTRGSFSSRTVLSGVIRSADSVAVTSPNGAWGLSIRWIAKDGTSVKKGEKVLSMDTTQLIREIDSAELNVTSSRQALIQERQNGQISKADKQHQLNQSQTKLAKAKLDADVPQGTYPRRTYESMQLAYKRAQSGVEGAQQSLISERKIGTNSIKEKTIAVAKAERDYTALQEKLATYILVAPRDGLLVINENRREGRPYQIGDKTWPGQTVLELPELSKMVVDAELSDVDDGRIHIGMKVHCVLDAYPDIQFSGEVLSISPVAQAPSYRSLRRSFEVRIQLTETDKTKMRPGMSVQVIIEDSVKDNVLLISRESLGFSGKTTSALLAAGGETEVVLSMCSTDKCIVLSGIDEGTLLRKNSP